MNIPQIIKITVIRLMVITLLTTFLYLYFFSKSGYFYERKIKSELADNYGIHFQVLDHLGRNKYGYERLVMTPTNNTEIPFVAELVNGSSGEGGLPSWRSLNSDYKETRNYYYYPKLVEKHFGIKLREYITNYWETVKAGGKSFFSDVPDDDSSYAIPVTLERVDEIARQSRSFFEEAEPNYVFSLYYQFHDSRFRFGEETEASTHIFSITGITRDRYNRDGINTLMSETEIRDTLSNQILMLSSREMDDEFDKLCPRFEQKHLWIALVNLQSNLTDYVMKMTVQDVDEANLMHAFYTEYVKAERFAATMSNFTLTEIRFDILQDDQDRVYIFDRTSNGVALDREDFITRLRQVDNPSIQ